MIYKTLNYKETKNKMELNLKKIGLLGKMASGKTTLANEFIRQNSQYVKFAFADKLKIIAKELFGMTIKDRQLLQQIGQKMREIKASVWIDYVINQAKHHQYVIIDDVRYRNEIEALKNEGFTIIYLNIDKNTQISRLKTTYGNRFHDNLEHESECADQYESLADLTYSASSLEEMTSFVKDLGVKESIPLSGINHQTWLE